MGTKTTACIVTHNNIKYIYRTVATLLEHTKGVDFTLYIVDNASTDGTIELVEKEFGNEKNLKIIKTGRNIGFGAGHNIVLDLINSDYHCVVNPDIAIDDDIILKMADYMEENSDIGLLSPRICFPDGRDQILGKRDPKLHYLVGSRLRDDEDPNGWLVEYAMLNEDYSKPFDIENATGCFMFFRTKAFKSVGGFDKRYFLYFEDCDISREISKTSRVVFYPGAVVYHEWGRDSKRNFKLMAVHMKSMLSYFWKWRR
ncbi:MAG: glycosyltransferase family 2 protein [Oscillospiraceae bacterium]|jgi:GT2 family glycosyltransferase|nr:glycosyltransferase family 2 protein [Oscillospiraceae bacterium]